MDISQLRNPYDFRNPVRESSVFAGRKQEQEAIRYELGQAAVNRPSVCVVLHGPRAAGKTSLLNATDRMSRDRGFTTVRVELVEGDGEPIVFYRKVYEELLASVTETLRARDGTAPFSLPAVRRVMAGVDRPGPVDVLAFPEAVALTAVRDDGRVPETALRADLSLLVGLLGHPITLMVDEAQLMAADARVLSVLRFLTSRVDGLVLVLAGTFGLMDQIRSVHSQIMRQFKEIEVTRFVEHEDVQECVLRPITSLGLHRHVVAGGVVWDLMQLTDGNPYEIQLYCHEMFARMQAGDTEVMELTPQVLEAIRSRLESGRNLMDRPLIKAVRAMPDPTLTAFSILTSALGTATADQAWFAHVIAGEPKVSRETYNACHREFVDEGLLTANETITLASETELLDEIYVRVYTIHQLGNASFTGRSDLRTLYLNRLLLLMHDFALRYPMQIMPTCCPMMEASHLERGFLALRNLPVEGPDSTPIVRFVHAAVLAAGEPAALDLSSVTCRFGDQSVERWLFSSAQEDVDLRALPEFAQAAEQIAHNGGELTVRRNRVRLGTWPADEWFGRATGELRTDLARAHRDAAYEAYGAGDRAKSIRHFRAAYELNPNWHDSNNLTHVLLATGAFDDALAWAPIALGLAALPADRAISAYNMAVGHLISQDPAAATQALALASTELEQLEVAEYPMAFLMVPGTGESPTLQEEPEADLYTAVRRVWEVLGPEARKDREAPPASTKRAPVVLAVATEWSSSHGGLSTLNRELCCALVRAGATVYCIVLASTLEEVATAATAGVTLLPAPPATGEPDDMRLSARPALPDGTIPDLIVGHSRVTGFAARRLVDDVYPQARRLHFIHMAPDEIEWHKAGRDKDAAQRAAQRTEVERNLGAGAHRVIAVGPRLHEQFLTEFTKSHQLPLRLDPGFDIRADLPGPRTPPGGQPLRVLVLGRTEDAELKGVRLAAAACGRVDTWLKEDRESRLRLFVRGARAGTGEAEREAIRAFSGIPDLDTVVREYTTNEEAIEQDLDMASLLLMPSRSEGFGLVGVEAITRGVPVLISSASGLGQLLHEVLGQRASRFVITVTGDADKDTDTWARAVDRILRDRERAFQHAAELRDDLSQKVTWATAADTVLSQAIPR
ncbi:glycosyltransferase [Streptomyces sp. ISL-66]|uniref:glycosyltransferase n=1 Tax=Streptomyces sp. ISL-66 TaxID=2819186 RepID=UPI001BE6B46C|nr:glycosyltransferase [Streptomyces sp. ISL-66]MBT2470330.1 glycosyltransferase [Streptomyces sp. ISL-66]